MIFFKNLDRVKSLSIKTFMSHSIEFQLFAPYNKEAALVGCFSNWEPMPMEKDDRGYFRTQIELEDGTYQYKFRVRSRSWFFEPDQWIEIVDPYATDIDNPTQNGVIRIKDGEKIVDTYVWQHDDKPLPADRELVIYEMHVGDFSGGEDDPYARGQYKHVIEKLDYLCELGVNAIELMPVKEYPGDHSWGYNPRYFFATESSYGSTADLKHLIDECHARGIRVFLDGIYNHSESESPLTQIDHDYWYHHDPKDPEQNWGPEFNYELYDENLDIKPAWQFIGDNVRFWIEEYHIDGIRYDAAKNIGNYDFMHWIVAKTKEIAGAKPFYNVAEHLPETPTITNLEGPMDGCWQDAFYHTVKAHICGDTFDLEQLKDVLDCKRREFLGATNVVNYLGNHDHDRMMKELSDRGIFDDSAFKRMKLGAVLLATAVGIPLIWMGEEFGEYKEKTIDQAKIDWTLLGNDANRSLLEYYKGLIHLRKNNQALYTENIEFFHENPECHVLAYARWNDEGSRVVVVANLSDNYLAGYQVPHFPANGTWHEWTGDYDVESGDDNILIDLPEYEAKVFVWQ
jgi:1,4-alpha-glucan branching enzyme